MIRCDLRSDREILLDIERRLKTLERIVIVADQDFETELARLTSDVTSENTQIDSMETLLSGISAQLKANANDPAAISALADAIEAKTTEIANAVAANTPAAAPATPADAGSGDATAAAPGEAAPSDGSAQAIPASGPGSDTTGQS